MTKKKDLKERVRARQEKTGESYTAALAQIRSPAIAEAPSATREALDEGLHCDAVVSRKLRAFDDLRPLFAQLRVVLESLGAEACGPLRGGAFVRSMPQMRDVRETRLFLQEVSKGFRGLSPNGQMLALNFGTAVVVVFIALFGKKPMLQLCLLDELVWPPELSLLGIGR